MTSAALRARVRALDDALRLPGALWVEGFESRETALDDLRDIFNAEINEESRQCEEGLKDYRYERRYEGATALRPAFLPRRTAVWHTNERTVNLDLNVTTRNVPEFRPYVSPEEQLAATEAIVAYVLMNLSP